MYTKTFALTGAFAVLASAVPMAAKRDVVWVTKVEEDVVTVPVTTTVWVDPTGAPQHFGHNHGGHHKQTTVLSTSTVLPSAPAAPAAPASSAPAASPYSAAAPSSSSEAAPVFASVQSSAAPSSSSVYVAPSSSSVYVAPTTSSSVYVAPTTQSAYVAPTTSSSVYVAPTSYAASSTSAESAPASYAGSALNGPTAVPVASGMTSGMAQSGKSYSGDFTYFQQGTGACGDYSDDNSHMVAISHVIFDAYASGTNSNYNPICGTIVNLIASNGETFPAQVLDRCVGCAEGDLDMPLAFFNETLGYSKIEGRIPNSQWSWA